MKIHEYQAKELLAAYGVPVPEGLLALTPEEAKEATEKLGGQSVVKAQVHCGGRGKAGGVKLAKSPEEAFSIAQNMLGMTLVSKQTGPEGKVVHKVYITKAVDIRKEYYLSLTADVSNATLVIIASGEGGTEIEETSEKNPEAIVKEQVSILTGLKSYEALEVAKRIGIPAENRKEFAAILQKMYKLYVEKDCSLIEINPLILTGDDSLSALDAKITFDDNALARHPEVALLRDEQEEDPKEVRASKSDLNYVALDGNIGCMVNGAGLAMATMDIIKKFGGSPANFLDVGGSATEERVTTAFEILLSDPHVKAIMVNIFGGIMKCDIIASGIVAAAKAIDIQVPVVVRLEGTNVELGKKILEESGLALISAKDMADAARKSVSAIKE
ncbi:MAG TPA: ADP-forming succinate--CoA ligase subunit beta [Clostridiales bacterium]|nr:ADP-forming succinate--CoA ligase subunit beta [Clostridiales bacterium]